MKKTDSILKKIYHGFMYKIVQNLKDRYMDKKLGIETIRPFVYKDNFNLYEYPITHRPTSKK